MKRCVWVIEELTAGVDGFGLLFCFCFFFARGSVVFGLWRGVFGCCPCSSLLSICGRGCAFEVGGEWKQELAPYSWFLLCSATYSVVKFSSTFWKFLVLWFKIASRERGFIACEKGCWSQVADRPSPAVFFQPRPALKMALPELWAPWRCLSVSPVLT